MLNICHHLVDLKVFFRLITKKKSRFVIEDNGV